MADPQPPKGIDPNTPSPARVYDYLLGGTDNYAIDRAHAQAFLDTWPEVAGNARANRAFAARAVRHLSEAGVDQFLDVGSGLPTAENVHQIAQRINPAARVQYVDNDPIVLAHGRAILAADERTSYVEADARDPEKIIGEARTHLDFGRPIGLLFTSVIHYVPRRAAELVKIYADALAPGSHLVISHVTSDGATPELLERLAPAMGGMYPRTVEEVHDLFQGWPLMSPGLVDVQAWRPDDPAPVSPLRLIGAAARKP